ncbi:PREDICTED: uncharacterized protein LOC105122772 [Populus euphratica]|uniref:Uncharacterized protein LOC105122772 n=1 Tax=Populus euphratica TaxID=75702 RepID=A0AAJ6TZ82_POPEU|nr:PREDICTED: uncharacterized protein LOC105122772 [Populus euphratica]
MQVNSRGKAVYDGHGSVGPIQRTRIQRKFVAESPSRGSANYHSTLDSSQNIETGGTNGPSEFLLADSKPQSSEVGVPTVPPYSRQGARKILEHLDSNLPNPKEKSAEFRLATSWKKLLFNKNNSLANLGGLDSSGKSDQDDKRNSVQGTVDRGNVLFNFAARGDSIKANDAAKSNTSASDMKAVPNAAAEDVPSFHNKPPTHSSGNKPVLPSITIDKPDQRWALSSYKSSGFTFLVSASPGTLFEPPTPTIMPSTSVTVVPPPEDASSSPYSLALRGLVMHLFFLFLQQATTLYNTMHLPI